LLWNATHISLRRNALNKAYNYVLDPAIRRTLNLDLKGSVVVLDEAHNIEDTLCESGSGDFGEIDLCHLLSILTRYSNQKTSVGPDPSDPRSMVELNGGGEQSMSSVAHELVLFLEKVVNYMRSEREKFETGPGMGTLLAMW
jgi:Rad3-related DNA helicase